MFELKPISGNAVPAALEKAERYRLLNEPRQAESICRDVLAVDAGNQKALVILVLALSDQLERRQSAGMKEALDFVAQLDDGYARAYYSGIVCERRGHAVLKAAPHHYQYSAYGWYRDALDHYARAEEQRPQGNDEAILRWNTVVRLLERHPELQPEPQEPRTEHMLE